VIIGSSGSDDTSAILSRRITVLVSRTPRKAGPVALTMPGQELCRRHDGVSRDPSAEAPTNDP
jgi:hypothetical protein